ncbi:MAG TPA: XRE family transcriptional regulator [Candidatus Omnitrophota bacterium]|mgnify:CR=1 FL=1|nr:XRE family transcriptional regulator [Candidatus Omnitrophota bacterium]
MYIGARIKELRKEKRLSLKELAEKSGVQIATLSRIEHLKMMGTVDSHMKIAQALGVDITQLYTNLSSSPEPINIKTNENKSDVFVANDKTSKEVLISKALSKKMLPVLIKIEPKGKTKTERNPLGSEKFIYILEGDLCVYIKEESFSLSKTNSIYFDASLEHYFENKGHQTAKALSITTPVNL